ncbi:MAG: UDP-2,4-diacetamido-2,4,6-trideoxy-beta-L-altropyranose hydrolase [Sulfurimonas sp.]|nr:UDP-2,4-diacetamido-2,4,6-trideoxy-beta-L-altropyranose hydrolase [Sulfurimonas sp.]MDQ7059859.1 UDP-2,4-diacetamido-2,4,6-trideoxy-beta-L-altropyranose hydrolase [Sulfurimonas sp.]
MANFSKNYSVIPRVMSNKLNTILFRTDSSSSIGTGHIMRDLVLASQYSSSKIIFATQNLSGNINHLISQAGYKVKTLKSNRIDELDTLIKEYNIDLLVVDNYDINYKDEKKLKTQNSKLKILSFDDTYEKHYCDILLNHNLGADKKRYKNLVPKHCELRCGSEYTLLRDEFLEEKKKKRVFIAMGGADHTNINIKILKVLNKFDNIEVNLVTTDANKNLTKLKEHVKSKNWIHLHINSKKIAQLMKQSDFAIVTPSVTLNEVYFMELAFIAIKTADNQKEMYKYLKKMTKPALKYFDNKKLHGCIKRLLK